MMNNISFNPVSGNIKCPLVIAWIAFLGQIFYIDKIKGVYYISYLEVIFSILLLFSFQSIALLLSLSNSANCKNYELYFKIAFILSLVSIGINLLSIAVILLAFSSKLRVIIQPTVPAEISQPVQKYLLGFIAISVKFFQTLLFFIFLCYKRKLFKGKGHINMPEMPEDKAGLMDNESEKA